MFWSGNQPEAALTVPPPTGYSLRTHQPGDEGRFFEIMSLAGWPGWDEEKLAPWLPRILPEGWLMAIHDGDDEIAATCMAMTSDAYPGGGELGWLACDPAHQGVGLGEVVSAEVTTRFLEEGYTIIHLYTEHYRPAAIKTYLKLGYIPFLSSPEMAEIWRIVCKQLNWPFSPKAWTGNQ